MQPLILVTNDDGIRSPGLRAAVSALAGLGELLIIAPSEQQSGMSRSLPAGFDGKIHRTQLRHEGRVWPAYHLAGSPAQAVLYGIVQIAARLPDLVVSGINFGENLGTNTAISGTVGAALQGADMGSRAIAFSLETKKEYHYNHGDDVDWSGAIYWLTFFARKALAPVPWPDDVAALKIDVPADADPSTPWQVTRQSRQSYYVSRPLQAAGDLASQALDYEIAINPETLEPDSDIRAFAVQRIISVTPLSLDLTARVSLNHFQKQLLHTP